MSYCVRCRPVKRRGVCCSELHAVLHNKAAPRAPLHLSSAPSPPHPQHRRTKVCTLAAGRKKGPAPTVSAQFHVSEGQG